MDCRMTVDNMDELDMLLTHANCCLYLLYVLEDENLLPNADLIPMIEKECAWFLLDSQAAVLRRIKERLDALEPIKKEEDSDIDET